GGAHRPVGAVVRVVLRADAGVGIELQVVERPDSTRGLACWARAGSDLHRRLAGAAGPREVGGERLLVAFEDLVRLRVRPGIDAGDRHDLHEIDDLAPAGLVETELQRVAGRVAAGAVVHEDLLHARVLGARLGQRRDHHLARQLAEAPLGIRDLGQREVLAARRGELDRAARALEAERLRPHTVPALRQRREEIFAG